MQCLADACVFRLMEVGRVVMTIVVNVDDIFAVGEKPRYDQFGRDLNQRSRSKIWESCVGNRGVFTRGTGRRGG